MYVNIRTKVAAPYLGILSLALQEVCEGLEGAGTVVVHHLWGTERKSKLCSAKN